MATHSFKQFLEEGRDSPLYHSTRVRHAYNIVMSNVLKGSAHEPWDDQYPMGMKGIKGARNHISFTRSYQFALNWTSAQDSGRRAQTIDPSACIIEFDQRKLAQRYKIIPYNYFNMPNIQADYQEPDRQKYTSARYAPYDRAIKQQDWFYAQSEEVIVADALTNVNAYITKLHLSPARIDDTLDDHPKAYVNGKFING